MMFTQSSPAASRGTSYAASTSLLSAATAAVSRRVGRPDACASDWIALRREETRRERCVRWRGVRGNSQSRSRPSKP